MKSIYQYLGILSMLLFSVGFGACTDEVEYSSAEVPGNVQAYFPNNMASKIDMDRNGSSFTIYVSRVDTKSDVTVQLSSEDKSGNFVIPTTATFKAGESTAPVVITYTYSESAFPFEKYFPITISLQEEEYKTPYATVSYSFFVGVPAPYKEAGYAVFQDNVFFGRGVQVPFLQNELPGKENWYRIVNPYGSLMKKYGLQGGLSPVGKADDYLEFQVLKPGDKLGNVLITQPNLVYFKPHMVGFMLDQYGIPLEVVHPSSFGSMQYQGAWVYNKVLDYNEDGSLGAIQLAPMYYMDGLGGMNYSQEDENVLISFNGYVIRDFDLALECKNISLGIDGQNPVIQGNLSLGSDVAYAKAAVCKVNDVEAAVGGLIDGTIEGVKITESGAYSIPFDLTGKLAVVLVGFDAQNEAQSAVYAEFKYVKSDDPYVDLVRGKSIDDYVGLWKIWYFDKAGKPLFPISGYRMEKKDATTLYFRGMAQLDGHDDAIEISYNPETGLLRLVPQPFNPFNDPADGHLIMPQVAFHTQSGKYSNDGALVGGFTETGELLFINEPTNVDPVVYLRVIGKDTVNGKMYAFGFDMGLEWLPDTPLKATSRAYDWEDSNVYKKFVKEAINLSTVSTLPIKKFKLDEDRFINL